MIEDPLPSEKLKSDDTHRPYIDGRVYLDGCAPRFNRNRDFRRGVFK